MPETVRIDGSFGEGGGQILRTSLSLSILANRPMEILSIRAGRSKPGLQPQHLTAVRAAASLCNADVEGASIGSTRLFFAPRGAVCAGDYRFEVGTAGAATLVAQTAIVPLAVASGSSQVTIAGGTHVPHAPAAEYVESVYLPALRRAAMKATFQYARAGFYPKGGGEARINVEGGHASRPVHFVERGELRRLKAFIVTSGLPEHVARRGQTAVVDFLESAGLQVDVECRERPSTGPGAAVVLAVECSDGFAGFTSLGERGKPMERVAKEACGRFLQWWRSGAACDEHLADQLVLPMAVVQGESCWTTPAVTNHLRTVLHVAGRFLPVVSSIHEQPDGSGMVTIRAQSMSGNRTPMR